MQGNGMIDLVKAQMLMQVGGASNPWKHVAAVGAWQFFERHGAVLLTALWGRCRRHYAGSTETTSTPPKMPNKELRSLMRFIEDPTASLDGTQQQKRTQDITRAAVIAYVTSLPQVENLRIRDGLILPDFAHPLEVSPDVYLKIIDKESPDGFPNFTLGSYEHDIRWLHQFIEKCREEHARRTQNKLGSHLYYFDHISRSSMAGLLRQPPSGIGFTKNKFVTTRSFDNVFFTDKRTVQSRVDRFLNNYEWYSERGLPHQLGFLFHGDPGCGKTSTIKAIANATHRHIINVHLSDIKTNAELKHLFYDPFIYVADENGVQFERIAVPVSERLYVIEDIDAMESVVLRRDKSKAEPSPKTKQEQELERALARPEPVDPVDLSTLLNILDGTLELPGRVLIISSNYPERLDHALIRPGRIDMCVKFTKVTSSMMCDIFQNFYGASQCQDLALDNPALDMKWTPAETIQQLFKYEEPAQALAALLAEAPEKAFALSHVAAAEPPAAPPAVPDKTEASVAADVSSSALPVKSEKFKAEEAQAKAKVAEAKVYLANQVNEVLNTVGMTDWTYDLIAEDPPGLRQNEGKTKAFFVSQVVQAKLAKQIENDAPLAKHALDLWKLIDMEGEFSPANRKDEVSAAMFLSTLVDVELKSRNMNDWTFAMIEQDPASFVLKAPDVASRFIQDVQSKLLQLRHGEAFEQWGRIGSEGLTKAAEIKKEAPLFVSKSYEEATKYVKTIVNICLQEKDLFPKWNFHTIESIPATFFKGVDNAKAIADEITNRIITQRNDGLTSIALTVWSSIVKTGLGEPVRLPEPAPFAAGNDDGVIYEELDFT